MSLALLRPPRVELSWNATALGSAFGGYRLYRRSGYGAWTMIAELGVPTGGVAADCETYHNRFIDYEAGWGNVAAASPWNDGHDYRVTVVNATTGAESAPATPDTLNVSAAADHPWIVTNRAPWLNFPVPRMSAASPVDDDTLTAHRIAGRDLYATTQRLELPGRIYQLAWDDFGFDATLWGTPAGEDVARLWRAAAASGYPVCLHRPLGDKVIGSLGPILGFDDREQMLYAGARSRLIETGRGLSGVADAGNLPPGLMLTGTSSEHVTTPSVSDLNPGSSAFTVLACMSRWAIGAADGILTKGDITIAGDGYGLYSTDGTVARFRVDGASAAVNVDYSTPGTWRTAGQNIDRHVLVGTTSGTAQAFYADGALTPVATGATTHGAVTNGSQLTFGSANGAAGTYAASLGIHVAAIWLRALTAAEAQAAAYAALGYPGWRYPAGAVLLWDLGDTRSFAGTGTLVTDRAGTHYGTLVNTPAVLGIPYDLSLLDRFTA